ncbi:photosynthetic reaction center subunit H [Roseivivax marinus]|jgi:photosynthetic reaction center H subunit|uniref:photosynthetic reaction center subunit H n=1 Tax=Roseivivax marinus TaxID=1379903 RepID=UPI0008B8B7F1|nr:photosynthetic reaction center subunit H [Roseivivax marinus]UMA64316.1 photosynthetic reaction center subunit H [Roseivivax marinus]SEK22905.1 photosynthetic reaction center H subunit [Roseivivax marinus]
MINDYPFGNLDLASLSLWVFFIFFVGLVIWLQRENQREGYPLVDEDGTRADAGGIWPVPSDKTFILPHGHGEKKLPSQQNVDRSDLALSAVAKTGGFPFMPSLDPMKAGVGPGSWAPRSDLPELDGHGKPKIVPMSTTDFHHAAGRDPRGMPVVAGDDAIVGMISDMWVDEPEQLVRYLQIDLDPEFGGGARLVPMTMARIRSDRVQVRSIYGAHFAGVPTTAKPGEVTKLEEEKIMAYYGAGLLYADEARSAPRL